VWSFVCGPDTWHLLSIGTSKMNIAGDENKDIVLEERTNVGVTVTASASRESDCLVNQLVLSLQLTR